MRARPIETTRQLQVPFERARQALLRDISAVLADGPADGSAMFAELSAELGHAGTMRQRVEIRVRSVRVAASEASWGLWWRAMDHPGLFPVFHGQLRLTPDADGTTLSLVGEYEPPLWVLGRFGDGLIGHRLARQSLEGYLERLGERVEAEAHAEMAVPQLARSVQE
jgi:hypothetical protein